MVKEYLTNYARSLIYSTGPSFPTVATIRASIDTLRSAEGDWVGVTLSFSRRLEAKQDMHMILMHLTTETRSIAASDKTFLRLRSQSPALGFRTKPGHDVLAGSYEAP